MTTPDELKIVPRVLFFDMLLPFSEFRTTDQRRWEKLKGAGEPFGKLHDNGTGRGRPLPRTLCRRPKLLLLTEFAALVGVAHTSRGGSKPAISKHVVLLWQLQGSSRTRLTFGAQSPLTHHDLRNARGSQATICSRHPNRKSSVTTPCLVFHCRVLCLPQLRVQALHLGTRLYPGLHARLSPLLGQGRQASNTRVMRKISRSQMTTAVKLPSPFQTRVLVWNQRVLIRIRAMMVVGWVGPTQESFLTSSKPMPI